MRHWWILQALLFRTVWGIGCDVGDAIEAIFAGDGQYRGASIAAIDLIASTPEVTVVWDDGSSSHLVVSFSDAKKQGESCESIVTYGLSWSVTIGQPSNLIVTHLGEDLTTDARLLITDQSKTCGSLSATQSLSVSSPPQAPIGSVDLVFYDVEVDTPGAYKLCFWSGQSVNGMDASHVASYATAIGMLVAVDTTTTTITTTTSMVPYSRRRGRTYTSASLTVNGSQGAFLSGLTVNPAQWNSHFPWDRRQTCRKCRADSVGSNAGDSPRRERQRIVGPLVVELPSEGCDVDGKIAQPYAPSTILMVARGRCTFEQKALMAAQRGFKGLLVVDYALQDAMLPDMAPKAAFQGEIVPAWAVPQDEAQDVAHLNGANSLLIAAVEDLELKPSIFTSSSDQFGPRNNAEK